MINTRVIFQTIIFSLISISYIVGCGGSGGSGGGGSTGGYTVNPAPGSYSKSAVAGDDISMIYDVKFDGNPVQFTVGHESTPNGLTLAANGNTVTISSADDVSDIITVSFSLIVGGSGLPDGKFDYVYNITYAPQPPDPPSGPYLIYTEEQLRNVKNEPDKHYILMNDISLTQGAWEPIGSETDPFIGTFDGGGFLISNVNISSGDNYQGFFGYLGSSAVVKDLGVSGNISGADNVGNIAGYNSGTITNSYAMGSVSGVNNVGNIAGYNNGIISNSYTTGSVSGADNVGNVAGYNSGTINNSYATGSVSGVNLCGGIAGYNSGTITNNAALGIAVMCSTDFNRVVGSNEGTISNNYANFEIRGVATILRGDKDDVNGASVDITEIYAELYETIFTDFDDNWIMPAGAKMPVLKWQKYAVTSYSVHGVHFYGSKLELAEDKNTIGKPNIENVKLHFYVASDYELSINGTPVTKEEYTLNDGDLKYDSGYYTIEYTLALKDGAGETATQSMRHDIGLDYLVLVDGAFLRDGTPKTNANICGYNGNDLRYFLLTEDIAEDGKLTATTCSRDNIWYDKGEQFLGIFDGNGHIAALDINVGNTLYQGFFGYLGTTAIVKNLSVSGNVTGDNRVGGIAGINYGIIINTYSRANISGANDVGGIVGISYFTISYTVSAGEVSGSGNVGGIAGTSYFTISDTVSTGKVSGSSCIGGIVGANYSTISNSYSRGDISGANDVGGIVGYNSSGTISNIYSTGNISGTDDVGGIVGFSNEGAFSNIYSTGNVSGKKYVGGIMGIGRKDTIDNAYSTGNISGAEYIGGIIGYNNCTISNAYATGVISGNRYVGGIAGMNIRTITNSAGLMENLGFTGPVAECGPIVGENEYASITSSYYFSEMKKDNDVMRCTYLYSDPVSAGTDSGQISTPQFWSEKLSFSENIWDLDFANREYKLPILKGIEPVKEPDMPKHLKTW